MYDNTPVLSVLECVFAVQCAVCLIHSVCCDTIEATQQQLTYIAYLFSVNGHIVTIFLYRNYSLYCIFLQYMVLCHNVRYTTNYLVTHFLIAIESFNFYIWSAFLFVCLYSIAYFNQHTFEH